MKHDTFLLDVRHDGEIYSQLRTVEGETSEALGRITLEPMLKEFLNGYITRLYEGKLDRDEMISLGKALYQALFPDKIGKLFESAEKAARKRYNATDRQRRLRLMIKVDHRNEEVLGWPMEFLHPPYLDYLSTTIHIALSRQITFQEMDVDESPVDETLRVLIVICKPEKLGEVMSAKTVEEIVLWAEKESLRRTTEASRQNRAVTSSLIVRPDDIDIRLLGDVQGFERPPKSVLHYDQPATFQNIKTIGENWFPHVLHFVGHGRVQKGEGSIGLITDDYDPSVHWTRADEFAKLYSTWQPRLVVLQACQSAQAETGSGFMHTAGYLVRKGIPAVVAMQFEIRNDFATEFASAFYRSLTRGLDIDAAVQDGRKDLATFQNMLWKERHFAAPVLFMISGNQIIEYDEGDAGLDSAIKTLRQDAKKYRRLGLLDLARETIRTARQLEDQQFGPESIQSKAESQLTSQDSKIGPQERFSSGG